MIQGPWEHTSAEGCDESERQRLAEEIAAPLLVPLALADLEVAVAVLDHPADDRAGSAPWADLLRAATGARLVDELAAADLVVAHRAPRAWCAAGARWVTVPGSAPTRWSTDQHPRAVTDRPPGTPP